MPHPTSLPTAPRREEEQKDERKRIHHEDKKSTKKNNLGTVEGRKATGAEEKKVEDGFLPAQE
jgi:hypothetical protein